MEFERTNMKIKIIGIGGGGGNSIKRLSKKREQFGGSIEFYAANTDAMALSSVLNEGKDVNGILLGETSTKGNGAGGKPEIGKQATEESRKQIEEAIGDAQMLFITAGMGGGTGTGGAPIIAQIASERQILTIGVVTMPFDYEGTERKKYAQEGIREMRKYVDVMIVASNQKAFDICGPSAQMQTIFEKADDVLANSIKGITDIIFTHSLVNVDFADVCTVLRGKKTAHIGLGHATGENRMFKALKMASTNVMLNTSIDGAKNIIVYIIADKEITGDAINKANILIPKVAAKDAMIIHGVGFDTNLQQEVKVIIIASGLPGNEENQDEAYSNVSAKEEETDFDLLNIVKKAEEDVPEETDEVEETTVDSLLKRLQERK